MSLYDGLELDTKSSSKDVAGWSSSIKLLQSHLQVKKNVLTQAKKEKERQSKAVTLAPVVDLSRQNSQPDPDIDILPPLQLSFNQEARGLMCAASEDSLDVANEYDPLWPNDYEKLVKERKENRERAREEDLRKREMDERDSRRRRDRYDRNETRSDRRERDFSPPRERDGFSRRRDEEEDYDRERPSRAGGGAAIAPPPSLVEDVKSSAGAMADDTRSGGKVAPLLGMLGGSVAARIMAKYGFREGQGLGKQEQGMSQALQVEKTSKRGGKIIHERDIPKDNSEERRPNMATRDPQCLIFEIPNTTDDEAVRIFLEFERIESATKAVIDLNGRFFGGRVVKAGFYNLDKFRAFKLTE
ncbi:PREDICTED: splicing factor 45-like [Priapulus caudatus]|uniref:Splicing factor 45 n=1 Tax=Priapulus caudatus TaxID=37621 RepID=A0ABM1EBG5_PRICU|nr:PREDICTED: splicing factor 45-like [Priapulus caudatus]